MPDTNSILYKAGQEVAGSLNSINGRLDVLEGGGGSGVAILPSAQGRIASDIAGTGTGCSWGAYSSAGRNAVTFDIPMGDTDYSVIATKEWTVMNVMVLSKTTTGFTFESQDASGGGAVSQGAGAFPPSSWPYSFVIYPSPTDTGPGLTSQAVTWTNLTEINLSGEKLVNEEFSNTSGTSGSLTLDDWTVTIGTLDQTQLASGIIQGDGGLVGIDQELATPIAAGTKLVAKVTRVDTTPASVRIRAYWSVGDSNYNIDPAIGYVEIEVPSGKTLDKIRFQTQAVTRSVTDISLVQGAVSGGSVQTHTGGGLEKISGGDGWNAGASSTASIGGNSNGYVQFQYAVASKAVKVGLVASDVDFAEADPYELTINADGSVDTDGTSQSAAFASQGDWFRIRHYASSNEIQYQRKQEIFDSGGASLGEDYVTFHTHSTLTNGSTPMYADTSFYHNDARINDVTIVS